MPPPQDLGPRDKIWESRIRVSLNVFRKKSSTLLSSFSPCNLVEHSRSSLEGLLLFHSCLSKYGCVSVG